jgi:hypothetical protein
MAWQAGERPQPEWTHEEILELVEALPVFDDPFDYDEALDDIVLSLAEKYGELWREAIETDLDDLLGR